MDFSFSRFGSGKRILFLHGFMENANMWNEIIPEFANYECVTIDLYGHGNSKITNESYDESLSLQADYLLKLIESFEPKETIIIGHSLGGYVALELLSKKAELFEKVILFHSHPWEDSPEKKNDRERVAKFVQSKKTFFISEAIPMLFLEENRKKDYVSFYIQMANTMTAKGIAWSALAMKNRNNYLDLFVRFPKKLSVIQGQHDSLIPRSTIKELCKKFSVEYQEIKNVSHMSHVEDRNEAINKIRKALTV